MEVAWAYRFNFIALPLDRVRMIERGSHIPSRGPGTRYLSRGFRVPGTPFPGVRGHDTYLEGSGFRGHHSQGVREHHTSRVPSSGDTIPISRPDEGGERTWRKDMHSDPPARGDRDRSVAGCRVRTTVCDAARRPGVGDCDACPCFCPCFLIDDPTHPWRVGPARAT